MEERESRFRMKWNRYSLTSEIIIALTQTVIMSKKTSKAAAARARAARWSKSHQVHCPSPRPAETKQHHHKMLPAEFPPIELDFDDGSDCGYTGGVNYVPSDMDEDTNESLIHPDEQSTDCESIQELEGDELEANLA